MPTGQGTIEIDFGTGTGSNEASVAVTGQASILTTHSAEAFFMREASTDHTVQDQSYAPVFISLTCGVPTAATGFTIYGRSEHKMTGKFKVRWVWA